MIEEFKKLMGDDLKTYDNHSIHHSEMYLFWKFAQKHNVRRILESGTYHGSSARRLRLLFPEAEIITFELREGHYKRIKRVKGVDYRVGELKNHLKLIGKNTAVLIDGPKRKLAVRLASQCLSKGALFVGMHDMYEYLGYLKSKFKKVVHSGKPSDEERQLDITAYESTKKKEGAVVKCADLRNMFKSKLYGPVLAIVCKK